MGVGMQRLEHRRPHARKQQHGFEIGDGRGYAREIVRQPVAFSDQAVDSRAWRSMIFRYSPRSPDARCGMW